MFLFGLKRKREEEGEDEEEVFSDREKKRAPPTSSHQLGTVVYSTLVRLAGTIGIAGAKDFIRFTSKGLQSQLSSHKHESPSYVSLQQGGRGVFSPDDSHVFDTSLMSPPPLFDRSTSPRGASPFSSSILNKPMQSTLPEQVAPPSFSPKEEVKTSLISLHSLRRKSAVVAAFKAEKESQNSLIILPRNVPFPQVAIAKSPAVDDSSSSSSTLLVQHDGEDSVSRTKRTPLVPWAPLDSEIDVRIARAKSALFEALAPAANDRDNVLKYIDKLIHTSTSSMSASTSARLMQEPLSVSTPPALSPPRQVLAAPQSDNLKVINTNVTAAMVTQEAEEIIDLLDDDDDDVAAGNASSALVSKPADPQEQWRTAVARMDLIVSRRARENAIRMSLSSNARLSDADVSRLASCLFPFQDQEVLLRCCPGGPLGIAGIVGKDSVTWRSIQCLVDGEWLNDEVINFEAKRISLRVRPTGVWVTSSHFYSKLAESAPSGTPKGTPPDYSFENVKRWTEKEGIDIRRLKAVIIPLHVLPVHWAVIVINLQRKSIHFFDSLFAPRLKIDVNLGNVFVPSTTVGGQLGQFGPALRNCARWVKDEFAARGVGGVDVSAWRGVVHSKSEVPQQGNSLDCGVFCLFMTKMLAEQTGPCFDDDGEFEIPEVPLIRRQIALSIVNS